MGEFENKIEIFGTYNLLCRENLQLFADKLQFLAPLPNCFYPTSPLTVYITIMRTDPDRGV